MTNTTIPVEKSDTLLTVVPPSAPGAALSPELREQGIHTAMVDGVSASVFISFALGGIHKLSMRSSAFYATIPAAPLRVFAAIIVTGAFAYTAGLSQARHSTQVNIEYAQAIEMRDLDMKKTREKRTLNKPGSNASSSSTSSNTSVVSVANTMK